MSTADTQHRLDEIEKQLANLVEEQTVIKAKWDSEKELILILRFLLRFFPEDVLPLLDGKSHYLFRTINALYTKPVDENLLS